MKVQLKMLLVFSFLTAVISPAKVVEAQLLPFVVCVGGNMDVDYYPGVTYTPQSVDVSIDDGSLGVCVGGGVSSATIVGTLTSSSLSCVLGDCEGTLEVTWNTNETSVIPSASTKALRPNGTVVALLSGVIESGKFAGRTFTSEVLLPSTGLTDCVDPGGVTALAGTLLSVTIL